MKKILYIALLTCLPWTVSVRAQSTSAADEEAVKATIVAETKAFYSKDLDALHTMWVNNSNVQKYWVSAGGTGSVDGYEAINQYHSEQVKSMQDGIMTEVVPANLVIRVDGNLAWARYDEVLTQRLGDESVVARSREERTMVKEGGGWKFVSRSGVFTETFGDGDDAIESSLNYTGYRLLSAGKVDQAIRVFQANVELFPNSWNVYDSLGEAYAKAGNKEEAIKNYEKSIQLNPKNENGKKMLADLKK